MVAENRKETIEMMWWWHTLFSLSLTHDFPRNFIGNGCQKLSVKPLACSLWLHMSFKHCDVGLDRKWSSSFLRATHSERRSKIMQINGEKGGEIGVERRKRMTVEVLLCFENYCFSETEIPDWWAACQYVNDKNISVCKGSNFHSRSNFHSSYLTMKGQFQLVWWSITLALYFPRYFFKTYSGYCILAMSLVCKNCHLHSLLAAIRTFHRREICPSMTEMPYWLCKSLFTLLIW